MLLYHFPIWYSKSHFTIFHPSTNKYFICFFTTFSNEFHILLTLFHSHFNIKRYKSRSHFPLSFPSHFISTFLKLVYDQIDILMNIGKYYFTFIFSIWDVSLLASYTFCNTILLLFFQNKI